MMAIPNITAAMATQVLNGTRSPNSAQVITAAMSGAAASTRRILATVVRASATTNAVDALEAGADIDFADPGTGLAALHIAVGANQLALVRALIEEWGATIGPDGRGRWPTVIAARSRVDDDLSDYIADAEAQALSETDSD